MNPESAELGDFFHPYNHLLDPEAEPALQKPLGAPSHHCSFPKVTTALTAGIKNVPFYFTHLE